MKLKVVNEYGVAMPLIGVESIKVKLPYENGETLEKSKFTILDEAHGIFNIELDDFEIQGLKTGSGQTFHADIQFQNSLVRVEFTKGLNIELNNDRKKLK